jgi:hypothetical protein
MFLQFVSGLLIANGVPHFLQGVSGHWFQTPFGSPPAWANPSPCSTSFGVRESRCQLRPAFAFAPKGGDVMLVCLGALVIALALARDFGRVRSGR